MDNIIEVAIPLIVVFTITRTCHKVLGIFSGDGLSLLLYLIMDGRVCDLGMYLNTSSV